MSSAVSRLEAGEDAVQLEPGPRQRVHHLAVAGLQGLDLRLREVAPAGEVGEDPLPQLAGLGDHRPPFCLGRLDLGFSGRLRLLAAVCGLDLGVAALTGGLELGIAEQAGRCVLGLGADLRRRLVGGRQHPRRLLPQLGGHRGLVHVLGGGGLRLLPGVVEIPRQPVPFVLEPAHLLGDLAEEGADGGRIEPLAGGRERRTGDAAG